MNSPAKFPALRRRRMSMMPGKAEETPPVPLKPDFPDVFVKAVRITSPEECEYGYDVAYKDSSELNIERTTSKDLSRSFCKYCKQKLRKDEQYNEEILIGEVSDSVLTVAHQLRHAKEQRKIDLKTTQMKEIMERVSAALEHSGLEFTDEMSTTVEKFDVTGETAKRKERDNISDAFKRSAKLSQTRNNVIEEIDTWLDFLSEDLSGFCEKFTESESGSREEHFRRINKALKKSSDAINRLAKLMKNSKQNKQNKKGTPSTLVETDVDEQTDSESKDSTYSMNQEKTKIFKKIYTEKELLQTKNTKSAVKMLTSILDDSAKSQSISFQLKSNLKTASKQFKIFATVLERKIEKTKDLDEKVKQLTSEVTHVKFLEQQKVKDQQKLTKLTDENTLLVEDIERLQQNIDGMENQMQMDKIVSNPEKKVSIMLPSDHSISEIITNVQQLSPSTIISRQVSGQVASSAAPSCIQINEDERKSSHAVSLYSAPSFSKRTLGSSQKIQKDSSHAELEYSQESFEIIDKDFESKQLQERIQSLDEKLNEAENTIKQQQAEMENMTNKWKNHQQSVEPEVDKTKYEKKISKMEIQLAKLKKELNLKNDELQTDKQTTEQLQKQIEQVINDNANLQESIDTQKIDFDIKDLPRDQLISKMKSQSEKELQRLRNYIVKEQQRFQANLRKVQLEHKKYVTSLRNEKTQMMRSLACFKKVITQFLYQEDEGEGVEKEEDNEEKLLLYQEGTDISMNAEPLLEMLVSLENNLNKALLQKRLTVKHANASKSTTDKTLQHYRDRLQKTTNQCNEQEKVAITEIKRNERLTKQFEKLRLNNENLQKEIAPCKELLEKYNSLRRDAERLNSEGKESTQEKRSMIKEFEQDRSRLKQELQKLNLSQLTYLESNQPTWQAKSCKEKIQLVNKAYEEDRISAENQHIATQVLSYSSDIVKQELFNFVKRYMELKKVEVVKKTMIRLGKKYKEEVRFSKYMTGVEKRYQLVQNEWLEKKQELKSIKENTCLLFTELLRQQNCHDLEVTSYNIPKQNKVTRKRTTVNAKVFRKKSPTKILENIVGQRLSSDDNNTSYWQMPSSPQHIVHVRTPKIVELDVNSWQRKLSKQKQIHLPAIATLFPRQDI